MLINTRAAVVFVGSSIGAVAVVLLLIWAMNGFVSLPSIGLGGNALIALIIGIVLTTGLAVLLMGLVCASERSGQDDIAYQAGAPRAIDTDCKRSSESTGQGLEQG